MRDEVALLEGAYYLCPRCDGSVVEVFDYGDFKWGHCCAPMCGWSGDVESEADAERRFIVEGPRQ